MNLLLPTNHKESNEECEALSTSVKNYKLSIREFFSSPIYIYIHEKFHFNIYVNGKNEKKNACIINMKMGKRS